MSRILIVEDDPLLRRTLAISLGARRFTVDEAGSAAEALETLDRTPPRVIILDLGLPDLDGISLIGAIRATSQVPILVLSARNLQSQKVDALEAGADDFITKPFGLEELVARLRVAIRRSEGPARSRVITTPTFTLDLDARLAEVHGQKVRLTPTEWRLVEALARTPGAKVSSKELLGQVWGPDALGRTHYLRVYFGHLRHKLEDDPANPRHFITVSGEGYRFDP